MKTKRLVTLSMFIGLSILLHWVESLFPPFLPIPGFRLGLANLILLFVLYYFDGVSYFFAVISKVMLVALVSQGFSVQFFMSLSGSFLSMGIALILYLFVKPSIYGVSLVSALFHTLGQLFAYALFFNSFYIFTYLTVLGPLSLASGGIMAFLSSVLLSRIPAFYKEEEKVRR